MKDEAIALRTYPFGNTSKIAVWLTRTHGKLATLAKGSQRGRSPLLGQFDAFYRCEILFYAREQRQLHVLKECAALDARPAFRRDWRACAGASYVAGLADRALPFGPMPWDAFGLVESELGRMAARTPGPASLPRFELRLLRELGLAPDWDRCARCRGDLRGSAGWIDAGDGALRCAGCSEGRGKKVGAGALAALRGMLGEGDPAPLAEGIFREIRDLAGGLLEHHADLAGKPRAAAFGILAREGRGGG